MSRRAEVVFLEVANRHRGDDPTAVYLRKLARTCKDMLDGRPVRAWRLDRLRAFCDDLSRTALARTSRPPCGGGRW